MQNTPNRSRHPRPRSNHTAAMASSGKFGTRILPTEHIYADAVTTNAAGGQNAYLKFKSGTGKDHSPKFILRAGVSHTGAKPNESNPAGRWNFPLFFPDDDAERAARDGDDFQSKAEIIAFFEALDERYRDIIRTRPDFWEVDGTNIKKAPDAETAVEYYRSKLFTPEGKNPQFKVKIKVNERNATQNTLIYVLTGKTQAATGKEIVRVGSVADLNSRCEVVMMEVEEGGFWFMGRKKDDVGVTSVATRIFVRKGKPRDSFADAGNFALATDADMEEDGIDRDEGSDEGSGASGGAGGGFPADFHGFGQ